MCECFQVGGKFIAEDPDCPVHGGDAQEQDQQAKLYEHMREALESRIAALEETVLDQAYSLRVLAEQINMIGRNV